MEDEQEKGARRPVSYDPEPCEGMQAASPSNPTATLRCRPSAKADGKNKPGHVIQKAAARLEASAVFRCTSAEKALLLERADRSGVSISVLLREALCLVDARRRRPQPKADPALLRELGRIGGDLNLIAVCLASASRGSQHCDLDSLVVATKLAGIERLLWRLVDHAAMAEQRAEPPC